MGHALVDCVPLIDFRDSASRLPAAAKFADAGLGGDGASAREPGAWKLCSLGEYHPFAKPEAPTAAGSPVVPEERNRAISARTE